MTPDVVVDIGNTRMKWGRCEAGRVADVIRLPLDDAAAWDSELAKLPLPRPFARKWAVASVNPAAHHRFARWSANHGETAIFENYKQLPIRVNVDEPAKVGIDRLLGAIAAARLSPAATPAITVDIGTAVTVNLIDREGVFQGGAIFPGPRLMARSLHDFTAKLPLIEPAIPSTPLPGKNTKDAILHGIEEALVGGIHALVSQYADLDSQPPWLFLTGGAHHLLGNYSSLCVVTMTSVPTLTLEGIRIAAEEML